MRVPFRGLGASRGSVARASRRVARVYASIQVKTETISQPHHVISGDHRPPPVRQRPQLLVGSPDRYALSAASSLPLAPASLFEQIFDGLDQRVIKRTPHAPYVRFRHMIQIDRGVWYLREMDLRSGRRGAVDSSSICASQLRASKHSRRVIERTHSGGSSPTTQGPHANRHPVVLPEEARGDNPPVGQI